ncbi:MAG TPA: adenylate/guanylate cyclase domain-containing protein [Ktedonobacteraceae bacterium]|nr:adenylate/guanylate cyclase domain-containing protein [Ktedonobacteraceae bacterium]
MSKTSYHFYDVDLSLLPVFEGIPVELLQKILHEDMVRFYSDEEVLFRQGDEGGCLVVLLHGQARVIADNIFLVTRRPYELIGEQAIINRTTRNATVIAQGMVKALVIPKANVEQLMSNVTFMANLLRLVSDKLSEATSERAFRFRNERLLFQEFRAHLSSEATQQLLAIGIEYGKPRYIDAIILFSDIRGFTERSAGMTPEKIADQLGLFLDATVSVIHSHEGIVDKFIGDAVMAFWGFAPTEQDPVKQAFTCAQEMVQTAAQMHFGGEPIAIGVGLNAGQVFSGNIGGDGKRQFTLIGTPVNLAARFEAETKFLGVPIVIGQAFCDRMLPDMQRYLIKHENHPIKGAKPQTIYAYTPNSTIGEKEKICLGNTKIV